MHDLRDLDAVCFHELMNHRIQRRGIEGFDRRKLLTEKSQQPRGLGGVTQTLSERLFVVGQRVIRDKEFFVVKNITEDSQPIPDGCNDLSNESSQSIRTNSGRVAACCAIDRTSRAGSALIMPASPQKRSF